MKRLIVTALERLDSLLDDIPGWDRDDEGWHWYRHGCWGCRLGLANKSIALADRWQTGQWS